MDNTRNAVLLVQVGLVVLLFILDVILNILAMRYVDALVVLHLIFPLIILQNKRRQNPCMKLSIANLAMNLVSPQGLFLLLAEAGVLILSYQMLSEEDRQNLNVILKK